MKSNNSTNLETYKTELIEELFQYFKTRFREGLREVDKENLKNAIITIKKTTNTRRVIAHLSEKLKKEFEETEIEDLEKIIKNIVEKRPAPKPDPKPPR